MTLLVNRAKASASEAPDREATQQNGSREGHAATGRKISLSPRPATPEAAPKAAPPEAALRTLQSRLQAQLNKTGEDTDAHSDPDARFLMQSVSRRLNQVNAALERIEVGKYGVCADCHEPIENDRLVLQPMATRCTRCQAVAEWRGSAY
jgi:RNA polymerase-binding transcription factor DksA